MFPLALAREGENHTVQGVSGDQKTKKHLASLGFVAGASVSVLSARADNLIVRLKDTRLALNQELAMKIQI